MAGGWGLGCTERPKPGPGVDAGSQVDGAPATRPRNNVKVPLPDGWSAQIAVDQSFRAGPPGHPVLRIDLRPGAAGSLPSLKELEGELRRQVKDAKLSIIESHGDADAVLVAYRLTPVTSDAGGQIEAPALVGARRAGADLFLCSTVPGASDEEVEQASRACASLSVPER